MIPVSPELRQALREAGDVPLRLEDPETQMSYVVMKAELYDRLSPLFEDRPVSLEEQRAALAHAGHRAGWDDPALDVYNDLDPRKP